MADQASPSPEVKGELEAVTAAALAQTKARQGVAVSVCIPAWNEEATIGKIVATVRRDLIERAALVDELIVLDDGSTDGTADEAAANGAAVVAVDEILPDLAAGTGKGNTLWKSLYVSTGDLVCFLDADVRNFGPHFVTRLLAPLLGSDAVGMVKAFYRRPFGAEPTGGGRVTELMARPLLTYLFPALTRFAQPLAGECAARRSVLEAVPFVEGWGVEIGLLIDVVREFGHAAVTQVDLGVREHRNRPLEALGPQALAILVTTLRRAGIDGDRANHVDVEVRERPPMLTIPAYRTKFGRELSA
jgi:glucosyl-3-phosphoglycerate synthase